MKEKVWTLTLCQRCKFDFEKSGYTLVKHGWQDAAYTHKTIDELKAAIELVTK